MNFRVGVLALGRRSSCVSSTKGNQLDSGFDNKALQVPLGDPSLQD